MESTEKLGSAIQIAEAMRIKTERIEGVETEDAKEFPGEVNDSFAEKQEELKALLDSSKDIAEEVDAQIVTPDDLHQLMTEVEDMTYIELDSARKKLETAKSTLKFLHNIQKQLEVATNAVNANIQMTNYLAKLSMDNVYDTGAKFFENYQNDLDNLDEAIRIISDKIRGYGDGVKSSKFLTNQMVETLTKKGANYIASYTGDDLSDDYEYQKLVNLTTIYRNRTDLSWMKENAKKSLRKEKKAIREMNRGGKNKAIALIKRDLEKYYRAATLGVVERWLAETFDGDDDAAALCLAHLRRVLETEKSYDNHNWAKVFIMNIQDIVAGIYDLEPSADEYREMVKSMHSLYQMDN